MNSILFIAFEDCEYSQNAFSFLKVCGFDITCFWASRKRKTIIPDNIMEWSGDCVFHLKSYCILPKQLLDASRYGVINFHPSPPKYPGSGGLNWGIYNGDKSTGVTVHLMDEKVDNGPIMSFYKVPIYSGDNIKTILPRVHSKQLEVFYDIVGRIHQEGFESIQRMINEYTDEGWGSKTGKIRQIDRMQRITPEVKKTELEKIIRATAIGRFGPNLELHGSKFQYKGEIQ